MSDRLAPGVHRHGRQLRAAFSLSIRVAGLGICQRRFYKTFPLDTELSTIQAWQREAKAAMLTEIGRTRRRRPKKPLSDELGTLRAEAERLVCAIAELERRVRARELAARESH